MPGGDVIAQNYRINKRIFANEVRLIDFDGRQVGVVPIKEALSLANERDLDLVEVAPNAKPPVCKVLDFGKFKYQQDKRHSRQKTIELKEVKVRPQINVRDLELKVKNAIRFLEAGNKVKITLMFRGREIAKPELGRRVFDKIIENLEGRFNIESKPKLMGRSMIMILSP